MQKISLKSSQRKALDRALNDVRCPSCNRQRVGTVPTAGLMGLCGACGATCALDVQFEQRPTRSGVRTVATVSAHFTD